MADIKVSGNVKINSFLKDVFTVDKLIDQESKAFSAKIVNEFDGTLYTSIVGETTISPGDTGKQFLGTTTKKIYYLAIGINVDNAVVEISLDGTNYNLDVVANFPAILHTYQEEKDLKASLGTAYDACTISYFYVRDI